jgi:hypothetical protein
MEVTHSMNTTKRILCIVVPLAAVNGALAFVVRGNCIFWLIVVLAVLFGLFVLAVGTIAWLTEVIYKKPLESRTSKVILLVGLLICSLGSTIPLGAWIHEKDLENAKQYCEDLIPYLDEHHQQYGSYPKEIGEFGNAGRLPWLLQGKWEFYNGHEKSYSFSFADPTQIFAHHYFDSKDKSWRIND